jgi:hypothetical protein
MALTLVPVLLSYFLVYIYMGAGGWGVWCSEKIAPGPGPPFGDLAQGALFGPFLWRLILLRAGLAMGDSKVICVSRESGYDEPFFWGRFPMANF